MAAALLVPAAAYGFIRVFDAPGAVFPIAGTALLSTAVAVLLRRLRVPLALSAVISLLVLVILLVNRFASGTTTLGIFPTGATRDALRVLLDQLFLDFQALRSPVPVLDPFLAAAMTAAWVMAFLTDWGALRLRLAFEPVLPGGLLFVFSAVLGAGTHQLLATLVFAGTVGFWAVTQRTINLAETSTWLSHDRRRGTSALARAGAVFAVMALGAGLMLGPRLPGAAAEPVVRFGASADSTRTVVSPFVSIESQLVTQSDEELFTVASDQPSYWRLAGLDNYEEDIWKVAGNFSPEDGQLPSQDLLGGTRDQIHQEFTVTALSAIWLPAAFTPTEIVRASADITWNAETSSLTVSNSVPSSNGITYSLVSSVPRFTSEEVGAAPETVPDDIAERYLIVPPLTPAVRAEAERVTSGAGNRYEQMLALQTYFQNFDYSTELAPRTGDPLEQFLTERVGFCQQFSTAFALMARHLGAPARVASGFTWGDPVGTDDEGRTIYRVTGRQAHAWPEVWFESLGWVAFEPTPGRGAPSATGYTNLPASQDSLVQADNPEQTTATSSTVPVESSPAQAQPSVPVEDLTSTESGSSTKSGSSNPLVAAWAVVSIFLVWVLAIGAVPGLYMTVIVVAHQLRRDRRRQRATSPATGVEVAWAEATEILELGYELSRRPAETRSEFAGRLGRDRRVPAAAMERLADLMTVARYYPQGLGPSQAEEAERLAAEVQASVTERVGAWQQLLRRVDPRRVLHPTSRITVTSPVEAEPKPEVDPRPEVEVERDPVLVLSGAPNDQVSSNGSSPNGHRPPQPRSFRY
jgi:transglutaminase-like putative cysteine protease